MTLDRRLGGLSLALLMPFAALLFLVEVAWQPLLALDADAVGMLHRHAVSDPGFVTWMRTISAVGSAAVVTPICALCALGAMLRRRPLLAGFAVLMPLSSSLLNSAVKAAVARPRPVFADPVAQESSASFPSGHAQASVVFVSVLFAVLALGLPRWARRAAFVVGAIWVLLVGFSRVALGVHYPSDVVAGYALGAAWVTSTLAIILPSISGSSRGRSAVGAGARGA